MTSLTQASIMSRKAIRYSIFSIIFIIIARFLILTGITIYKQIFPAPPPPPTVAFGKLPKLPLPDRHKLNIGFTLETAEGGLPEIPTTVKVFFMPKNSANLLSLDFAKDKAGRLGFNKEAEQTSESVYKFTNSTTPSYLETNIITGAFSISYDFNADPVPLSVRPIPPETASESVRSFLNAGDLLPEDLTGEVKHQFLKAQGGGFVNAISLSDANLVRIDLFRKDYEKLPVVTNSPDEANVWFMVSGIKERGKEVVAGEYHYFPVDETQVATYPLKGTELAWQELSSGNYYPASTGSAVEGDSLKIRRVYLAYYDAGVYTEFLQPVYVFEGDKDFVAYVPAVTTDYYGE